MYLRQVHAELSIPLLRDLIRANPLGVLTTAIPSATEPLIQASHVPWVLDIQDESSVTELGILRGHLARQNPQSRTMMNAVSHTSPNVLEQDVLVLFTATTAHYVTPKFYTATKPSTGKVVPTWNYAAAQVYGKARVYYDPKSTETSEFLQRQISDLTDHAEKNIMDYTGKDGRPGQWSVSDAPGSYINILKKNIIGIEIQISRLEGKVKMSQEMEKGDREGVVQGFDSLGTDVGRAVSDLVRQRSDWRDFQKFASS